MKDTRDVKLDEYRRNESREDEVVEDPTMSARWLLAYQI